MKIEISEDRALSATEFLAVFSVGKYAARNSERQHALSRFRASASQVKRVLIIGSSGAGKSTLSRKLADRTGLPLIHLDAEFWQPGWRETPREKWKQRVAELTSGERWLMDGNYGGTMPERIDAADTIVLLALPRLQCLTRVILRSIRGYGKPRADLNQGCNEQLPDMEFPQMDLVVSARKAAGHSRDVARAGKPQNDFRLAIIGRSGRFSRGRRQGSRSRSSTCIGMIAALNLSPLTIA